MTGKVLLRNASVVLANEVLRRAAVLLENGEIAAIDPESSGGAVVVDLGGKILMPGMIDLHCDALEKEAEPRPNVYFPFDFACAQADKRNAAAGISTVFHALSFAHEELGMRSNEMATAVARAVHDWQPHGLVDNRVHCRYEITDPSGLPVLLELLEQGVAQLVSVMDHTPGQGQFKDLAAYRDFLMRTYEKGSGEAEAIIARKFGAAEGAVERIKILAAMAARHGVRVASHDDDSAGRVEAMKSLGVGISEFPVNMEAARAAKARGLRTVVGAPNILRGQSQSGSMRALDAVDEGVIDCLCSDYAPATLIVSVLKLPAQSPLDLPGAVRLVTANPARAANLRDRGEIAVGKRADLIAVSVAGALPQVSGVWVGGVPVFSAAYGRG